MDPNQTLGIFECSNAELTPKFYMKNVPVWRTESPMGLFVGPVSQWHIWCNGSNKPFGVMDPDKVPISRTVHFDKIPTPNTMQPHPTQWNPPTNDGETIEGTRVELNPPLCQAE